MTPQLWLLLGTISFVAGLFFLAVSRGFTISKVNLFGALELNLPTPIKVRSQPLAKIPAWVFLAIGLVALGIGTYRSFFRPIQYVSISSTPKKLDRGHTISNKTSTPEAVKFQNDTTEAIDLFWIDFDGAPSPDNHYALSPHDSSIVETFAGHLWVAKSPKGTELLRYVVREHCF